MHRTGKMSDLLNATPKKNSPHGVLDSVFYLVLQITGHPML